MQKVASYNKQKDEIKTGETLSHVGYSESYTITLSQMKFRVHVLVNKTPVFLLLVQIKVKQNKAIWRRSLSQ